jgi:hypothetical protein
VQVTGTGNRMEQETERSRYQKGTGNITETESNTKQKGTGYIKEQVTERNGKREE